MAYHRTEVGKPFATRERHSVDLFFEKIELVEYQKEVFLLKGGMSYDALEELLACHHLVNENSIPIIVELVVVRQCHTEQDHIDIFKHLQPLAVFSKAAGMHSYELAPADDSKLFM